jgi:hypothetical protein
LVKLLKLNYRLPETEEDLKEWESYHKKSVTEIETPSETDFERMIDNIFKASGLK